MTVRHDVCKTEEGAVIDPYFVLEFAPWVQVLAFDSEKRVLITKQYRHGIRELIYGLPTGFAEETDASMLESARRELIEETGYDSNDIVEIGKLFPNPATQNNTVNCFVAFNIYKKTEPEYDPSERIEVEFVTIKNLLKMIDNGTFSHALHVAGIFLALRKLKLMPL